LRERERQGTWGRKQRERERETQADYTLSTEPDVGLDLMTPEIMT